MSNTQEPHHLMTAKRIEKLTPGRTCWFWLAQYGTDKQVSLYLHPIKKDPLAKTFVNKVQEKRKMFQQNGAEIKGQLQRTEKGTLLLTSPDPIAKCFDLFNRLSSSSPILGQSLANIVVVESKGGTPQKIKTWASKETLRNKGGSNTDVSKQESILKGMAGSNTNVFFWLGTSAKSKQPQLLLSLNQKEVHTSVKKLGKTSKGVSGKIVRSDKGFLVFRAEQPSQSFLEDLALWYAKHRKKNPGLEVLKKSRMVYRDTGGEIIDRQKNDNLW